MAAAIVATRNRGCDGDGNVAYILPSSASQIIMGSAQLGHVERGSKSSNLESQ